MIGFTKCDLRKKINYKEVICELQGKINELVKVNNEIIQENNNINQKLYEMEALYDFLLDEQGIKLPIAIDENKIEVGTIFRIVDGTLKYKKAVGEIKTINLT